MKARVATLSIVVLASWGIPGPAHAEDPQGALCSLATATDVSAESADDLQTGEIHAGPLTGSGTLTCTVQVGSDQHLDRSNDATTARSTGATVVVIWPTLVTYAAPPQVPVYLCTEFMSDAGPVLYWDSLGSRWTTDSRTPCRLAISGGTDDPVFDPVHDSTNDVLLTETGVGEDPQTGGRVYASCTGGPGVALGLNDMTYVVQGSATATVPPGSTAVGTTVKCWILDPPTRRTWGPVEGFAPGGSAFAAGTIDAQPTGRLVMCAEAYTLLSPVQPPLSYRTAGC